MSLFRWLSVWLEHDRKHRASIAEAQRHKARVVRRGGYMAHGDATKWAPPAGRAAASPRAPRS